MRAKSADQHHRTSAMLGGSGRFAWAGRACSSGGGDDERRDGRADGEAEEERALARVEAIDGTCGRARGWPRRARAHPPPYAHYIPGRSHARRGQKQSKDCVKNWGVITCLRYYE